MNETILTYFADCSEFEDALDMAEQEAVSGWEMDFVDDLRERYEDWGERMFFSENRYKKLMQISKL